MSGQNLWGNVARFLGFFSPKKIPAPSLFIQTSKEVLAPFFQKPKKSPFPPFSKIEKVHFPSCQVGKKVTPTPNSYPVPFISIHIYIGFLMDKWHWTSPRQIKVEKTVIYSFSLFETGATCDTTLVFLSVSMCVS